MSEHMSDHIYLASQSPRRRQLLEQWGVRSELLLPSPEEDVESLEAVKHGEAPARYVRRVTRLKLQAAMQRLRQRALPLAPVLCADTTVAIGKRILGKPVDEQDARQTLALLSGQRHQVLTAVALAIPESSGDRVIEAMSRSWVTFAEMTPDDIQAYVASGEPMGKAGAYAIQGRAAMWIRHISGSYSGIMGLPAHETASLLRAAHVLLD